MLQARVGIVVISALLLTAILIVLFGDMPTLFEHGTEFFVGFPSAPGVSEGTPVRKSGILIGRVKKVAFAEDGPGVVVTVKLDEGRELSKHEVCMIQNDSLLGDAVLEFQPGDGEPTKEMIKAGERVKGIARTDPLEMLSGLQGSLRRTLDSMSQAGDKVGRLADRFDDIAKLTNPDQIRETWNKADYALDQINRAMTRVNNVLGEDDLSKELRHGIEELPKAIQETRAAMASVRAAAERADRNLRNLEGLTGPLGERGEEIVSKVDSGVAQLNEVLGQLTQFTQQLNSQEGSLGRLMNDPTLYNNVNSTVAKIERLVTDVRPIVSDIRVFSDKIARDPGRLGVSGALRRESNNKYPNFEIVEPVPHHWREDLKPPDDWHDRF